MTTEESEAVDKLLNECADKLAQYTESVRIFVTYANETDGTPADTVGRGNYFAVLGQVKLWLDRQDERNRHEARKSKEDEDQD